MSPALEQLRDIRGLDPAFGLGSALGGWIVALLLVLVATIVFLYQRRREGEARWRKEVAFRLRALRDRLDRLSAHDAAGELGELLRRITIMAAGRRTSAGLVGMAWLAWLEASDPAGFPWQTEGQCLLELPYAPPHDQAPSAARLVPLIGAAEAWLRSPPLNG